VIRVGLVQMRCEKGALAENLALTAHYIAEAGQRRVDILAFPEMSLTGYADPTRYPAAMLSLDGPEVARFLEVTRPFPGMVLAGLIEANPGGKPFITQIAAQRGELVGFYRKITIEDEEVEWFAAGQEVPLFYYGALPFGVAICADISNGALFAQCSRQGARIIFELAAPGLYGEQATRDWLEGYQWWEGECQNYLARYAREHGVWIMVATQAGRTRDEDFPGGGYVFAPGGERVFATADQTPGAVFLAIDLETDTLLEAVVETALPPLPGDSLNQAC
jgi:predicted amidohydrolase